MKKATTKVLMASLMVMAALLCAPQVAQAETLSGECGDNGGNVTWTLDTDSGEMVIQGLGEMERYFGDKIAPWYEQRLVVKSIVISEGVTSVGDNAFGDCSSLSSVTIPSTVTTIQGGSFARCTSLSSVVIPQGVTYLGTYAFYQCTALNSVNIPDSVTAMDSHVFCGCTALKSITIPGSLTHIGYFAFSDCTALEFLTLSEGVQKLDDYAFARCNSLIQLNLAKSVTSIGRYAFCECTSLENVVYAGALEDRQNIEIKTCNEPLANAAWFYGGERPLEKGDVNANGQVNIVDAQIAYDISCGKYEDHPDYQLLFRRADVTGPSGRPDGMVDSQDAWRICRMMSSE